MDPIAGVRFAAQVEILLVRISSVFTQTLLLRTVANEDVKWEVHETDH